MKKMKKMLNNNKAVVVPTIILVLISLLLIYGLITLVSSKQSEKEMVVNQIGWVADSPYVRPLAQHQQRLVDDCNNAVDKARLLYGSKLSCGLNPCQLTSCYDCPTSPASQIDTKCYI